MNEIEIRKAQEKDVDFLIETIIHAEKSGTENLSYCKFFSISEAELTSILKEILEEDIEGQELCISGFLIAFIDNKPVGAICSWIEGSDGNPAAILKANIFYHFFGMEKCEQASDKLKIAEALTLEREIGAIQIESVYVHESARGKGISKKLIIEHVKNHLSSSPEVKKVQIILAKTNDNAFFAYKNAGFEIVNEKHTDNKEVLNLLPSDTLVLMENSVENIIKYL